jgi:ribonuclease inhibitor
MKEITLDGNNMTSIKEAHRYIKLKLNFPAYYGENLDALWDILSTTSETTNIILINSSKLCENLGEYSKLLLEVFQDVSNENDRINFVTYV